MGRLHEAHEAFVDVMRQQPDLHEAWVGVCQVLGRQGDYARAAESIQALALHPQAAPRLTWAWAAARLHDDPRAVLQPVMTSAGRADRPTKGLLMHALGDALGLLQSHDAAFFAHQEGNRLLSGPFNGPKHTAAIHNLIQRSRRAAEASPANRQRHRIRPILLVGSPESGAKQIEAMLSRHDEIAAGGARPDWGLIAEKLSRSHNVASWDRVELTPADVEPLATHYQDRLTQVDPDARCVIDRTPSNALLLGLVAQVLPHTLVVHCKRDPLDTAWECYRTPTVCGSNFRSSQAGLAHWIAAERSIMAHWDDTLDLMQVEVRYSDLLDDPAAVLRPVVQAAGLAWNPSIAAPGVSAPDALSFGNEVVERSSIGCSAPYRRHLTPFLSRWRTLRPTA